MFQIFVLMDAKQHKSRLLLRFQSELPLEALDELFERIAAREQCRCYGGDTLLPKGINYQHWREQMKKKLYRNGAKTGY
jgi:hypothetical protein